MKQWGSRGSGIREALLFNYVYDYAYTTYIIDLCLHRVYMIQTIEI